MLDLNKPTNASDPSGAWQNWHSDDVPIRLGVSSCLLGEEVRFDGGHARDRFVTDVLDNWVEWAPVCPEVEIGMDTPRPAIRLIKKENGERLIAPSTGEDFTLAMNEYSVQRIGTLGEIDGYVLKKGSPSCGMERIRVYLENGNVATRDTDGLFARKLKAANPLLPIEEDGRLNDPRLRENFIERVFCRNRWRVLVRRGLTRERLIDFHTAHKLILRSHDEASYQSLGRLGASFGSRPDAEVFAAYEQEFNKALRSQADPKKHTNVLQHALGHLKKMLTAKEKREILLAIEDYRKGLLPLVVPLILLRFSIVKNSVEYLLGQLYFDPHPKEMMLRNHV